MIIDRILESFEDETFMIMDGFDAAIIGVDTHSEKMRLIYSKKLIIKKLMKDKMTHDEAEEYYSFNISGSLTYHSSVNQAQPIICEDDW